jgi:hypothetical protein
MDIIEFFKKVTGLEPTEDQKQFLEALVDPARPKNAASCGRQTGKSLCSAVTVLWWIFNYPEPINVLLMSAMDSYVYDHIEQLFHKNPDLLAEVVVEGVSGLVPLRGFAIKKGSRVHVRGSTSKQVRGLGADIEVVDEAEEIPDELLTTALGNLRGELSRCVWLGTSHKEGLFTRVIRNPKRFGFTGFTWSAENCSWHAPELLKTKKAMMSHQQYKVEVLGQVLSAEDRALFPSKHIAKCIYDTISKENSPHSRIEAGIDWGFDPCRTVLCITERIFNRRRLLYINSWARKPIEEIAPEMAHLIEKHGVTLVKADAQPSDYKHKLEKFTKVPVYYIESNMHKDAMLSQLQRKIRQHTLELSMGDHSSVTLIAQLRKYRRGKRTGDDLVDALAFSCYDPAIPLESRATPTVLIL